RLASRFRRPCARPRPADPRPIARCSAKPPSQRGLLLQINYLVNRTVEDGSDFEGQDSFTIQVSGMSNGIRGSSDIRIIVSVGPNVSPQTNPTERRDRPPGDLSSAGQPNQNPTAQGTDQTRHVRLDDADASMDPSTRPARILASQQDTGPSQQGTGTNPTIGVAQVRPALVLPLQRDIVLNQTVFPLQQSTGANPTIGVPQVRPVLLLPQGTVQNALPLPLQQGTGTSQTIGVGQV